MLGNRGTCNKGDAHGLIEVHTQGWVDLPLLTCMYLQVPSYEDQFCQCIQRSFWQAMLRGGSTYQFMDDLRGLEAWYPKALPSMWPRAPSPVNATYLAKYLANNPDQEFATYICQGLQNGFHIDFSRSIVLHSSTKNHLS